MYMEKIATDLDGTILTVKICLNNQDFQITNIYALSGKRNRTQNHTFFDNLYPYLNPNYPLIFAGDFNCIENPLLDKHPPIKTYAKPQTLITLTNNLNLYDTYRTLHPTLTTYTHHAPKSQSRLDRFYVNPAITSQNHKFSPTPFSDHDFISLTIILPYPTDNKTRHPWKNNINTYKNIEYQTQISNLIQEETQTNKPPNPLQQWLTLKNKIRKLLKTQARNDARILTLEKIKTQQILYNLREEIITNPNKENFKSYNTYRKSLHTQFLKDAPNSLLKQKADLEEFQNISLNHLYKQLTPLRKHNIIPNLETQAGRQTTTQNEIVEVVETFYKNLYSSTNIDQVIASKLLDQYVTKLNPQQSVELAKNNIKRTA